MPETEPSAAGGDGEDFVRGAVEVGRAVHREAPLRGHDAGGGEVGFDGGCCGGCWWEGRLVDQKRFVLDGGIWCEAVGGNLVGDGFEVFEGREFRGHAETVGLTIVGWPWMAFECPEQVSDQFLKACTNSS